MINKSYYIDHPRICRKVIAQVANCLTCSYAIHKVNNNWQLDIKTIPQNIKYIEHAIAAYV